LRDSAGAADARPGIPARLDRRIGDSGAGIEAQRAAIHAEAERRGWTVEFIEDGGYSAKEMNLPARPARRSTLDAGRSTLEARRWEAAALRVSRLDRLSRSMLDSRP
jgi:DNA invertase Pin-like site-specific DNA recombinase